MVGSLGYSARRVLAVVTLAAWIAGCHRWVPAEPMSPMSSDRDELRDGALVRVVDVDGWIIEGEVAGRAGDSLLLRVDTTAVGGSVPADPELVAIRVDEVAGIYERRTDTAKSFLAVAGIAALGALSAVVTIVIVCADDRCVST